VQKFVVIAGFVKIVIQLLQVHFALNSSYGFDTLPPPTLSQNEINTLAVRKVVEGSF
jgi:hypothetical protein